jgi:predicted ArsR family transcriptional regulator
VGTFDALAAHAGVPPVEAQRTLRNLRYEGRVVTHRTPEQRAKQGRPRVVYAVPSANYDLDRLICASWR